MSAPHTLTVVVHSGCRLTGEALAASLAIYSGVEIVGCTHQWPHLSKVCGLRSPQVLIVDDIGNEDGVIDQICRVTSVCHVGRVIFLTSTISASSRQPSAMPWQVIPHNRGLNALVSALDEYRRTSPDTPKLRGSRLTEREMQVLSMVGSGMTAPQIADKLDIGQRSVENHKRRIYAKLGAHSQAQAISAVANLGAIPPTLTGDIPELSRREHEILKLAAAGQSVRQMARDLGIAPKTVESLLALLYRKLGVHSRASALAVAHSHGLLHSQ